MKRFAITLMGTLLITTTFSQTNTRKDDYLKFSGGRVSYGSGDFLGYGFSFDAGKNIIKTSSFALDKLLIGGEFIFENGVKNPVIENPTLDEFLSKTFYHVSSTILWPKASYYPFKKIVKGFNIQLGPTIGYSYRSTEIQARRTVNALGQSTRTSTLSFNNGVIYGYRISTGLEFFINKKIITGLRLDFSNNNEAEINTFAGLKIGIRLQ